jgi:hypothetical protein
MNVQFNEKLKVLSEKFSVKIEWIKNNNIYELLLQRIKKNDLQLNFKTHYLICFDS